MKPEIEKLFRARDARRVRLAVERGRPAAADGRADPACTREKGARVERSAACALMADNPSNSHLATTKGQG
jgi:hypothetical protein